MMVIKIKKQRTKKKCVVKLKFEFEDYKTFIVNRLENKIDYFKK